MSKSEKIYLAILIVGLLIFLSSSRVPEKKMTETKAAIEFAKTSGKEQYAKLQIDSAQNAYDKAEKLIQKERKKIPLFRNYNYASGLLSEAKALVLRVDTISMNLKNDKKEE